MRAEAVLMKPFQTSWDTDDGELSVSMTISARNSIEVSVAVADEGVMIATSISDIDEMIDILTRCKRASRSAIVAGTKIQRTRRDSDRCDQRGTPHAQ